MVGWLCALCGVYGAAIRNVMPMPQVHAAAATTLNVDAATVGSPVSIMFPSTTDIIYSLYRVNLRI